jgi:hypothetical protein
MVFYLLELSQLPHACSIAEIHSADQLFFATSKSSPVLGLNLPCPMLSPAVKKVDGYAVANS